MIMFDTPYIYIYIQVLYLLYITNFIKKNRPGLAFPIFQTEDTNEVANGGAGPKLPWMPTVASEIIDSKCAGVCRGYVIVHHSLEGMFVYHFQFLFFSNGMMILNLRQNMGSFF